MNRYVKFKNIVLIGMSGAGKTTVGKYIASKLNMEFVNTDDIIVSNSLIYKLSIFNIYNNRI